MVFRTESTSAGTVPAAMTLLFSFDRLVALVNEDEQTRTKTT
jgi:hypothetical protein